MSFPVRLISNGEKTPKPMEVDRYISVTSIFFLFGQQELLNQGM